jgi:probable F420-dependent oxidoreductase
VKIDAMSGGLGFRDMQALAHQVEDAGFSGLWITEGGHSGLNGCIAASLATERLDIGTGIALAFPRSPMITAIDAWELAEATNGRFALGLGTQVKAHIERRYSSTFEHPGPRLREYVLALKAIFRAFRGDEPLKFEGDFYNFSLLPRTWSPGPIDVADPPVYIAAVNPWMCRMTGEVADGVHVHPLHSVRYIEEVVRPNLDAGAASAGRDPSELTIVCPVLTIVGDTPDELETWRQRARFQLAFYGSTRTYAPIFELHGWDGTSARLHDLQKQGDVEAMAATITDAMLDVFTVTANWDGLADAIVARCAGVADRVVCYFATTSWRDDPAVMERWAAVTAAVASSSA